jgi:hypothetical protein
VSGLERICVLLDGRVRRVTQTCLAPALLLLISASAAAQPSSAPVSMHRPWVGVGFGWGNVTSTRTEGPDVLLSATIEMPVAPTAGVRLSAERIWGSARDAGEVSLRQLSADLLLRRPFGVAFGCTRQVVVGLGAGFYTFATETGTLNDPTRLGYQVAVGSDCVGGRLAIGGAFGFRFIDAPDHPALPGNVIAPSASLTIRIRL